MNKDQWPEVLYNKHWKHSGPLNLAIGSQFSSSPKAMKSISKILLCKDWEDRMECMA